MALSEKNTRQSKKTDELIKNGDFAAIGDALTYRQRRWCEEFILDYDATKAARRAGYKSKDIDRQGYQLLHHPGCKAYAEYLDREQRKNVEGDLIDKDYVVKKIISGLQKAEDKDNLSAYFRGLELLARHLGMFVDKQEISGPDGQAIQIEQRAKEEADSLIKTLQQLANKNNKNKVKEVTLV